MTAIVQNHPEGARTGYAVPKLAHSADQQPFRGLRCSAIFADQPADNPVGAENPATAQEPATG